MGGRADDGTPGRAPRPLVVAWLALEALLLPVRSVASPLLFLAALVYFERFDVFAERVEGTANTYRLDLGWWAGVSLLIYAPWLLVRLGSRHLLWRRPGSAPLRWTALLTGPLVASMGYLIGLLELSVWVEGKMEGNIAGFFGIPLLLLGSIFVVAGAVVGATVEGLALAFTPTRSARSGKGDPPDESAVG